MHTRSVREFRSTDLRRNDLHSGTRIGERGVGTTDAAGARRRHEIRWLEPNVDMHSQKARNPMGEIIDKTKGKIKQVAGTVVGNDKLKADGEIDELKGNAKGAVGDIKHAAKGAAK
jgi:uncharacterized protein YjbJ (UPF0337 family)